ncbi:MAG: SHOCT domain-containing protein, partial [Sphaerospermopsis kisseleviana]
VETELKKLEELKSLGVMDEEEFEIAQVKLNKRVNNFEKLYSLKIALERGLINEEEYTKRKALLE